jgi:integrase
VTDASVPVERVGRAALAKVVQASIPKSVAPDGLPKTVARLSRWRSGRFARATGQRCDGSHVESEPRRGRLTEALAQDRNQDIADALRLLLLTGARRNEVLHARWEQFDLKAGIWSKPHGMTKQQREHVVPLSAPARQLLHRLYEQQSSHMPWVFPGRDNAKPRRDMNYAWKRICKRAGIHGLRIHDLRHSYASHLVNAGFGLPVISQLLGIRKFRPRADMRISMTTCSGRRRSASAPSSSASRPRRSSRSKADSEPATDARPALEAG